MKTIKKTVLYSILFGFFMEFQINILLQHSIPKMIGVFCLYLALGILTYYSFPKIINTFESKSKGFWISLASHGLLGLFIIEWGLMNNTPWSVPDPLFALIAQIGMFSWWATIAAMPYILQEELFLTYKKKIFYYYGFYGVMSTILTLVYGIAPVILLEPPFYLGFFYFYKKYSNLLSSK